MKFFKMRIIIYNVEHGSCCHIITPNNKHILIDVGSKTDASIIDHINRKYFFGHGGNIDELIITHPHEDHIYDLPKMNQVLPPLVLQRHTGAFDITPICKDPTHIAIAESANSMNKSYNQPIIPGTAPTDPKANGGVEFKIISPRNEWTKKNNLNTFSSLIIVTYNRYKFVFTGDNPASILQEMIKLNHCNLQKEIENATVLLAPHHGRANEFCKDFFNCVNPLLSVISDKSIQHETQTNTACLYKGRGVNIDGENRYVLTTRNDGTIAFEIIDDCWMIAIDKEDY